MMNNDKPLAKPIKIGNRIVENRFVINAMECCDSDAGGNMTEHSIKRYENLFHGNAGVIFFESITLQYENRARDHQISLQPNNHQNIESLKNFIESMKKINNKPLLIFQLNHSGEVSSDEFSERVCVKPFYGYQGRLLEEEEIEKIMDDFVLASKILHDIGADGVDLKFCHGYLGSQILRPYNDRQWKYGGPWQNRSRFAFELTERIRKEVSDPNFVIGSKVSMWEAIPGGCGTAGPDTATMDLSESITLCKGLEERGANFILESAGNAVLSTRIVQPPRTFPEAAYLHFGFTKMLKEILRPETVVIGSAYSVFGDGNNMLNGAKPRELSLIYLGNKNIEKGYTDMVALGRQSLADPLLPAKYLEGRENDINWCKACDLCVVLLSNMAEVACGIFDEGARANLKKIQKK